MKSFTTSFLFLVGLITTCTASNIDVDNDRIEGLSSSKEDFNRKMATACYEKTGSNQTFEAFLASDNEISTCFDMNFDVITFMNDWRHLDVIKMSRFYSRRCWEMRRLLECLKSPVEVLRNCLDDDIYHVRWYNALSEGLNLLCKNYGVILLFSRDNACVRNNCYDSKNCTDFISDSTKLMAVSKFGEVQCRELGKTRDCMEGELKECKDQRLMDVLDVYWRAILKNSPCENMPAETLETETDTRRNEAAQRSYFLKRWPKAIPDMLNEIRCPGFPFNV